jgi:hypothetical chaperone protein
MTYSDALGIDFGTSNSAVGLLVDGKPRLVQVEAGQQTLPTSVFFDFEARRTVFGSKANAALINGDYGRFMRALKSILGTPLIHEPRRMMGETLTLMDVVARFLRHLRQAAEAEFDRPFERAVAGRPVRFHSEDQDRNQQAFADLQECYRRAGFSDVRFMFEPEAAAVAAHRTVSGAGWNLIVDIGGGTSDFSIYRTNQTGGIEIAASYGVRLGGTDFDRRISLDRVMPLLGKDSDLRNAFGNGVLEAPKGIFRDLATWQLIPFLYAPDVVRKVQAMENQAIRPELFARLRMVLEDRLGHDLAFAVEAAKIAVNSADKKSVDIKLGFIEQGLATELTAEQSARYLDSLVDTIGLAAAETLTLAEIAPDLIETVVFVGGSSLLSSVAGSIRAVLPDARFAYSDAFTAIVDGLTIAAGRDFD